MVGASFVYLAVLKINNFKTISFIKNVKFTEEKRIFDAWWMTTLTMTDKIKFLDNFWRIFLYHFRCESYFLIQGLIILLFSLAHTFWSSFLRAPIKPIGKIDKKNYVYVPCDVWNVSEELEDWLDTEFDCSELELSWQIKLFRLLYPESTSC